MKNATNAWLKLCMLGFSLVSTMWLAAQSSNQPVRCYTDEMDAILRANNSEMESSMTFEQWLQQEINDQQSTGKIIGGVYQIPVVVHVIHNGEAVGSGTNVSLAAIQSQIDVLNEDFRRIFGTNGYNTNSVGADTQIEFCLAKRRPDGSAFPNGEDGVNRINRTTAGFSAPPYTTGYIDGTIKTYTYNNNTPTATRGWDPNKYLNIWLCNISGGILGYAQFPESPLGGMGCGTQSAATDGVVFLYNSIGKSSVTGFPGPYNEGRTATHEIGHWLGLRHIWGDGNCSVDDFCNDTPVAGAANFGCPTGTNSCPAAGNDMIENYMDYTDDLCMNVFTVDQKARMRTVLENSPRRVLLINSDACTAPSTNDASVVDIITPKGDNCSGTLTPQVTIKNRGSATLTNCVVNYSVDNGTVTTFSFTGSLASGATANVTLPSFTTYLGTHTIKSWTTLPNGVADPNPQLDTTQLGFVISNGIMPPYTENFDGQVFPPDLRWVVENPNSDCYEWISGSGVSSSGVTNNNAALFPGFGNSTASTERLISPIFTLPCNASAASLSFNVAYRRRNTTTTNYDTLYVDISEDCGATWNAVPVFAKGGTALDANATTLTTYFQPAASTDWQLETINLLPFVTTSSKNVKFRFRAPAKNGQNIYVDNLTFSATLGAEASLTASGTEILDEGGYTFASTAACATTTATFTVTNTGASSMTLTGPITVTGTGFSLGTTFGATTLAAGASTTFTINFSPLAAGSYNGTVSFGTNDCDEGTYNYQIFGNATGGACASASFTATPNPACQGQTVTFTSTSTGATSYAWNFGAGATPATATGVGPHTVTYSTSGSKNVSLQINGTGPTANQTVTVNALPTTPTITAGGPTTFCAGGSVTLTASAGSSYLWSNGATTASINVTTAGTYSVQVTNAAGCQSAASAGTTVTVNALPTTPTITAGGPTTFCAGGSVTLSAPTSTSYLWSNGATTQSITVTTAGSYTVQVGNASGCLSASSTATTVTVNALPAVPTITAGGPTTFCSGGSVTLSAPASTSYLWSNGATTQTITVTTTGSYTVTVSNAAGCTRTSAPTSVTVNPAPATPTITAGGPTTFCTPGSVTLTSSSATGNTWSNGATTQSITVSASGSYTVTVTSAGCSSTSTATVVTATATPATPTITAGGPTTFCNGNTVTLTSSATSGNTWSTGATTQSITVSTAGTYTVTVGAAGCSATSTGTTVTVNALPTTPTITAGGPTTFCAGGSVTLSAPTSTSYLWSNGATTQSITVTTAGSYTVQVGNASGCLSASSTATTVTVNALPAVPTITAGGPTTFCSGGSVMLSAPAATSYLWSNGATSQTITVNTAGNYTVQVTNASGCTSASSAVQSVVVNSNPAQPVITANGSTSLCNGSTVDLSSSYTTGNNWSTGSTAQSITVSTAGSYTVTVTDVNGCTATSAPVTVTSGGVGAAPAITVNGPTTFCEGDDVVLISSSAVDNVWSTGESTQAITVTSSGTYYVFVSNGNCSSDTAFISVTVNPKPDVSLGDIPSLCSYSSPLTLNQGVPAGGVYTGTGVSGNSFDPAVSGLGAFIIDYSFTDANGCVGFAQNTIIVDDCASIEENNTTMIVYPNPATDVVYISNMTADARVMMYDAFGKIVSLDLVISEEQATFDVSQFANGVYHLQLISAEGTLHVSLTINH